MTCPTSFVLSTIYLQLPFWRWEHTHRASWQMTAQIWKSSRILAKRRHVKRMWEDFQVHLDLSLTMLAEFLPHCWPQCGRNSTHIVRDKSKWTRKTSHNLFTFLFSARIRLDFQIWAVKTLFCFCLNLFNGTIYFIFSQPLKLWQTPCIFRWKGGVCHNHYDISKKLLNYF